MTIQVIPASSPSMRVYSLRGTPGDADIDGRVEIAVHNEAATFAFVDSLRQGELGFHPPALRTCLTAGIPAVHDIQSCASTLGLVFQLSPELAERRIHDGLGQSMIIGHTCDVQVLDADLGVLAGEVSRELM